jgi:MFS family permease
MKLDRANQALVVAATAMLLVSFVGTATNIAVPVLEDEFPNESLSTISWVISGFNVTQVTFMLIGGRLADRLGRKRVFLTGMVLFGVGAALSGAAPDIRLIIAARVIQALGAALVLPSSLAAVLPEFPIERHATVVSLWSSMGILGAAAAPTVAAGLLQVSSWRAVFFVAAPISALAFVAGQRVLTPVPGAPTAGRLDLVGTAAGTTAVGGLVLVIVQGRVWGWTDPVILAVGMLAAVNAVLFVTSSRSSAEPLVDFGLFGVQSFTVVTLASALLATSTTAAWFLYPLFMIDLPCRLGHDARPGCAGRCRVVLRSLRRPSRLQAHADPGVGAGHGRDGMDGAVVGTGSVLCLCVPPRHVVHRVGDGPHAGARELGGVA